MGLSTYLDGIANAVAGLPAWGMIPAFSQAAGTILVAAVWQSAVLAGCLALFVKLVPRASASHRFFIWTAGFVAAIGLPLLPLFARTAALGVSHGPDYVATVAVKPLLQLDLRWSIAIACLWAAASLYRALDLANHTLRLRKLWKSARVVEVSSCDRSGLRISRRKTAELCTTTELERPSVIGFWSPRILIPEWLFARLTPGELDQIVLHEAEHLRRSDDWTNLLQKLGLVLFPLNPVLLWMERRLCLEREMACDEGVVRATHAPCAYAACLASLAERGLEHRGKASPAAALSLGVWQRRPELTRRVHRILFSRPSLGPVGARALLAVMGCGLVLGSVELSRCPQLIAFTAPRTVETAYAQSHVDFRNGMPQMVNTAYNPATGRAGAERSFATPRMIDVKATMPGAAAVAGTVRTAAPRRAPLLRAATERSAPKLVRFFAQPEPEMAGMGQVTKDDSAQEQSWIVLTTWEGVESVDPASGSGRKDGLPDGRKTPALPEQVTVTQLIFRVLPARSDSRLPAPMPIRSGWLVIQL
jgi:beta-lactamase regulating signal transducer with metallopeptidase domain